MFGRNFLGTGKGGIYGEVFEKSHTNHSNSAGGEWKVGNKPGQSPTKSKKITVSSDGTVIKKNP